jgi:NADPH-dependent F420 reductase
MIGSRTAAKAERRTAELNALLPADKQLTGADNLTVAQQAELIVLSVPYSAQQATLAGVQEALADKILVTVVAPLGEKAAQVTKLPSGLSAAEEAQQQVGDAVRVVAAFQNISAHHLMDVDHELDCDVLICGAKAADKNIVSQLCTDAGMRGVNAGSLASASVVEGLTAVLIGINIRHKIKNAGIRITGI